MRFSSKIIAQRSVPLNGLYMLASVAILQITTPATPPNNANQSGFFIYAE